MHFVLVGNIKFPQDLFCQNVYMIKDIPHKNGVFRSWSTRGACRNSVTAYWFEKSAACIKLLIFFIFFYLHVTGHIVVYLSSYKSKRKKTFSDKPQLKKRTVGRVFIWKSTHFQVIDLMYERKTQKDIKFKPNVIRAYSFCEKLRDVFIRIFSWTRYCLTLEKRTYLILGVFLCDNHKISWQWKHIKVGFLKFAYPQTDQGRITRTPAA